MARSYLLFAGTVAIAAAMASMFGEGRSSAQVKGGAKASGGSVAIEGNNNVVRLGLNERELRSSAEALMRPLAQQSKQDRRKIDELQRAVGANEAQLNLMLQLAGRANVPEEERWKALAEVMAEYKSLKAQTAALPSSELKPLAEAAVAQVRLDAAKQILAANEFRRRLQSEARYTIADNGAVTFTDGWDKRNISAVHLPQLKKIGFLGTTGPSADILFYNAAHEPLRQAFAELERRDLLRHFSQWGGAFTRRTIMRSKTYIFSHPLGPIGKRSGWGRV